MKDDFPFLLGCNGRGAQASSADRPVSLEEHSIDEQFRLVKEAGVFDPQGFASVSLGQRDEIEAGQASSISEIENGWLRPRTSARTRSPLLPRPRSMVPTRSSNSR